MTCGNKWQMSVGSPSKYEARPVLLSRNDSSTSSNVGMSLHCGTTRALLRCKVTHCVSRSSLEQETPSSSCSKCCCHLALIASSSVKIEPSCAVTVCNGFASLRLLFHITPIHRIFCSTSDGGNDAALSATC